MLRFAVPPTSCPGFDTFFDQHLFFPAHAFFQGAAFAPLVVACGGLARPDVASDALANFLAVARRFEDLERRKEIEPDGRVRNSAPVRIVLTLVLPRRSRAESAAGGLMESSA